MEIRVETVAPEATFPLRNRVLRPYLTPAQMRPQPGELDPGAVHLAALAAGGEVIGTAVLLPEPFPQEPERPDAWRLRGMAVDEGRRGGGIGAAVLREVIGYVAGHGGGLIWCNARAPARRFYERAGFAVVGDAWDEPDIGPHVRMWREVPPAAA